MTETSETRSLKDYLYLFFTGMTMGAADVVPGVSGGTMAFIMGVYEELIEAITSIDKKVVAALLRFRIKEVLELVPWRFLLALGGGIIAVVFTLAGAISFLLDHYPVLLYAFFFGLVLASIVAIAAHIRWSIGAVLTLIVGAVTAYLVVGLVPAEMPHDPLIIFLSGSVAIMAMILPGISGSFILLILGQYAFVLNAVKTLDVLTLLPFVVGIVVGITSFARVLRWMLDRFQQMTLTLLVGFMAGSLRKIWPFKETVETMIDRHGDEVPILQRNLVPDPTSTEVWLALGLAVVGFAAIRFLDRLRGDESPFVQMTEEDSAANA